MKKLLLILVLLSTNIFAVEYKYILITEGYTGFSEEKEIVINRFNSKVEASIKSHTKYQNYTIYSQSFSSSQNYRVSGFNIFMSIIYIKNID